MEVSRALTSLGVGEGEGWILGAERDSRKTRSRRSRREELRRSMRAVVRRVVWDMSGSDAVTAAELWGSKISRAEMIWSCAIRRSDTLRGVLFDSVSRVEVFAWSLCSISERFSSFYRDK